MTLGTILRKKREALGLSQWDVCEMMNYTSGQYISNWERDRSPPPMKRLKEIAKIYKISPDAIVDLVMKRKKEQLIKALR